MCRNVVALVLAGKLVFSKVRCKGEGLAAMILCHTMYNIHFIGIIKKKVDEI